MTPARARYVLSHVVYGSLPFSFHRHGHDSVRPDGITRDEDRDIRALWGTMAGTACYFDAVCAIARGAALHPTDPDGIALHDPDAPALALAVDADGVPLHLPESDPLTIDVD